MNWFNVFLKLSFAFVAAMMFWFLEILLMTAYAFMPGKEIRSAIVLTAAPVLYLIGATFLFKKFFKTKGWQGWLADLGLVLAGALISLGLLSLMGQFVVG